MSTRRTSTLRALAGLVFACGAMGLDACSYPFGPCETERIEVTLDGSIRRAGVTSDVRWIDSVADGNVGRPAYEDLRAILIEGASPGAVAVVWTIAAFDSNPGAVAFAVNGTLSTGTVLPVQRVFDGGGWGRLSLGAEPVLINVRAGDFIASSVTGTLQVLDSAPLRLHVDVEVASDRGERIRIQGEIRFQGIRESGPCT